MFEQNLIGLDDAEVGVVRQNDVVDGVEGIDPLPLRAQNLLEQTEIFDRDSQLLGASLQEFQFFGGPLPAPELPSISNPMGDLLPTTGTITSWRIFSVSRHSCGSGPAASRVVTCGLGWASSFEISSVISANPASRRKSEDSPTA